MAGKYLLLFSIVIFFYNKSFAQNQKALEDSMQFYFSKDNFAKAVYWGEKNAAAVKQQAGATDTAYSTALTSLGLAYFSNGNYNLSKSAFLEAMPIIKNNFGEKSIRYVELLDKLGVTAQKLAAYSDAENYFLTALKIQKELSGENSTAYAEYMNSLGVLYRLTERYGEAEALYIKAGNIFKAASGEENTSYLTVRNNLASLYYSMGKISLAEKIFLETIPIKKKVLGEDSYDYGNALSNLGVVYYNLGNFAAAESLFTNALAIFKKQIGEKNPQYAATALGLAAIYQQTSQFYKAEKLLKEILLINENTVGKNSLEYARTLNNLGTLYCKMGKDSATEQILTTGLTLRKNILGAMSVDYAVSLNNLALYYTTKAKYTQADSLYKEAITIRKNISGENNQDYISLVSNQCELYQLMGRNKEASEVAMLNLSTEESLLLSKLDFMAESELIPYLKNNELAFSMPYSSLANYHLPSLLKAAFDERLLVNGIALQNINNLSKEMALSKDSLLVTLWKNYRDNKLLLNKALGLPAAKRLINTDSLTIINQQQEKGLLRQSASFRNVKSRLNISWQDIRNNLKPTEAAIEFVRFKSIDKDLNYNFYYAAMLLRAKDTMPVFIKLFSEGDLQLSLKEFAYKEQIITRSDKQIKGTKPLKSLRLTLYDMLWQPLEVFLSRATTIYFAPDGLLHTIAFAAMPDRNGKLLCDKYNLIQVTSTRQIALKEDDNKPPASIALFGGINYNKQNTDTTITISADPYAYVYRQNRSANIDSFVYLPNTLKEVEDIKKNMELRQKKVSIFIGDKATEAAFRNLGGAASPEVIHFATHGFTSPDTAIQKKIGLPFKTSDNPLLRSGLVLAGGNNGWKGKSHLDEDDGILTALEISAVSLKNTQLAVLSACETGAGELRGSEGVFGLQRAFKIAGVNYVMASLWQVPDKETSEFMNIFYVNWLQGKNIRQAFITTQQLMHKKYPPYYWAAFTLVQ